MEILIFLIAFPVWFAFSLLSIVLFILWMAGFNHLSKYFLIDKRYAKNTKPAKAKIRFMHFQGNIELGIYTEGIFVQFGFPFNLLINKTFFIPWNEIKVIENYKDDIPCIEMEWGPDKIKAVIFEEEIIEDLYIISETTFEKSHGLASV